MHKTITLLNSEKPWLGSFLNTGQSYNISCFEMVAFEMMVKGTEASHQVTDMTS